jgi:hypothetical protein
MFGKLLGVVKKVAGVAKAVAPIVDIVPGGGVLKAAVLAGTKRFSIDKIGGRKILKGAGLAALGAPLGIILQGLARNYLSLPDFLFNPPVAEVTLSIFVTLGCTIVNTARKFLTEHPEIKAIIEDAVD